MPRTSGRLPAEEPRRAFYAVSFEPYAPVRLRLWNLLRWVDGARHAAGLEQMPASAIRTKRYIVKSFGGFAGETWQREQLPGPNSSCD